MSDHNSGSAKKMPFSSNNMLRYIIKFLERKGFSVEYAGNLGTTTTRWWRFTKNHYNIIEISEPLDGNDRLFVRSSGISMDVKNIEEWKVFWHVHKADLKQHQNLLVEAMQNAFEVFEFMVEPPPPEEEEDEGSAPWSMRPIKYPDLDIEILIFIHKSPSNDGSVECDVDCYALDISGLRFEVSAVNDWPEFIQGCLIRKMQCIHEIQERSLDT